MPIQSELRRYDGSGRHRRDPRDLVEQPELDDPPNGADMEENRSNAAP
jgi:hypothetical protein